MAQQKTPSAPSSSLPPSATGRAPIPPKSVVQTQPKPNSQPVIVKKPVAKKPINVASMPFWLGLLASVIWVGIVLLIIAASGPAHTFGGLPLSSWAIGVSAIVSPVALIWMVTAYMQRAADIQSVAEPLRRQLSIVTGESGIAEARIRRFNAAIREQVELLRSVQSNSHSDLSAIIERVQRSRSDLEQFEHSSIDQVREIQEIIRRNMQQVEQLMDDKFTMMRVLDDKLVQSSGGVARQTEVVREQIAKILEEVEGNSRQLSDTLEKAVTDSKKLSDTSRIQESSLVNAAENASEILAGVSSKIDLSVARFLERAGTAREEAERLAGALDTQTRALDEFSTTLPARVSETEVVLRGVADRLYSSEQLAREQATNLSDKLSQQVDNLHAFMDRFALRLTDIDSSMDNRHSELDKLATRITGTAGDFVLGWEKTVDDLTNRSDSALMRFGVLNDETRKNADGIAAHLKETTDRYEDAAGRMHGLTTASSTELKSMTAQIDNQLKQFDALQQASHKMGEEVETRASAAMQNLQYVLERLLAAREATQTVGETLVKDLFTAVDQNETLISRLNEAAQMSVRALGIASESLGKQEGDLVNQSRAAEQILGEVARDLQQKAQSAVAGLKEQTGHLTTLLAQAQIELQATDGKIQSFVARSMPPVQDALRQVDDATEHGLKSMAFYNEGLKEQLGRLQGFNANVGGMGSDLTRITGETIVTIEQMQERFTAAKAAQENAARQSLAQFSDLSERLQREVGGLDGQAGKAVASLQDAAARVGEQSYQMLQTAETSGAKIQLITTALQTEATQIRSTLQKQADDLSADLSRAEKQFSTLGEAIQQRTDAAYSLLNRVASHYNETTSAAAQNLDARAERLSEVTGQVQTRIEAISAGLGQQLAQLGTGSSQLEAHANQISTSSSKALQQLTAANEKLSLTHDAASRNAQQTITRLEEAGTAFSRQTNSLADAAQGSTALIQKTGITFGEQTSKLLDQTRAAEQQLRQLSATTTTMAEQATQVRSSMEQQNQRLASQLTESIAQIETSSVRLQQTSSAAISSADQAATRFNEVSETAAVRLGASSQTMSDVAGKAETTLSSLGISVAQQSAALSVLGDQLAEQHRVISISNDNQRQQLVELFDKLGASHSHASEVAERTITRLTESLNQIQLQLGTLSDQSQTTVGNVRNAGESFSQQASVLVQNAQQAEHQARTVLSVTAALQDQARQLREALHGEGERAGEMLGGLISKLTSGGIELRDLSSTTEMSLTSLNNGISTQAQTLSSTMQQISDRQRTLTIALDAQRDVMNGLLSRLSLAQDETASVAERTVLRLTDNTQQLTRQIEGFDTQAKSTIANIEAANSNFVQESNVINSHAREAEQQVRAVMATSSALQDQMRQVREQVQTESDRAGDMLGGILSKLSSGSLELREIANSTGSTLTTLHNEVSQQSQDLSQAMQQISDRQRTLGNALDTQRDVMSAMLQRLTSAQEENAGTAERSVARLTDGSQQLILQIESLDEKARATIANIEIANSNFTQEVNVLNAHARDAEQQARSIAAVSGVLQEQMRQAREGMQTDGERAGELLTTLVNKLLYSGNQVREVASSTETVMTGLNAGISQQSTEITGAMQQIIERQKVLTGALSEQRDMMGSLLNRVALAQDETASAAERTVVRLTDGAQQIVKQLEAIGSQAQTTLSSVQAAGKGFADESGTLGIHAQQAEQHMRGVLSVWADFKIKRRDCVRPCNQKPLALSAR